MLMLGLAILLDSVAVQVGAVRVMAEPRYRDLGIALAELADRPVEWPGLGRQSPPAFTLIMAADSSEMARLTRGRAPGWGAGVAFPQARIIVLRADLPDVRQTLRHEIAHLMLRANRAVRVPLWFDEGYATWATGEFGGSDVLELNLAVAMGKVPSLQEVDRMLRASARTADLAYALAASAVGEIARRPEPGGLDRLLERLNAGDAVRLRAGGVDWLVSRPVRGGVATEHEAAVRPDHLVRGGRPVADSRLCRGHALVGAAGT